MPPKKHKGYFAGRTYNLCVQDWSEILNCSPTRIFDGLVRTNGNMQELLDTVFKFTNAYKHACRKFLFPENASNDSNFRRENRPITFNPDTGQSFDQHESGKRHSK